MRSQNYRIGSLILFMYSIRDRHSFEIITDYYERIKLVKEDERFPAIVIGNMSDLVDQREISFEEGQKWADDRGFPFIEASAATGSNVYSGLFLLFIFLLFLIILYVNNYCLYYFSVGIILFT